MNPANISTQTEESFKSTLEHFNGELNKLRTGRANAAMLDGVTVEVYGTTMPLNQVATVTAPEAQLLQITPFDPNNLQAISAAIRNNQSLGFNPSDDGRLVRVVIPPLTEERRREIAKQIGEKVEDAAVRMRSARHEAFKRIDSAKKDKQIGEDEAKRLEKNIDDSMGRYRQQIDSAARAKETEILTL